jgi:hypothetical protein
MTLNRSKEGAGRGTANEAWAASPLSSLGSAQASFSSPLSSSEANEERGATNKRGENRTKKRENRTTRGE